jgi:hypothetical protein
MATPWSGRKVSRAWLINNLQWMILGFSALLIIVFYLLGAKVAFSAASSIATGGALTSAQVSALGSQVPDVSSILPSALPVETPSESAAPVPSTAPSPAATPAPESGVPADGLYTFSSAAAPCQGQEPTASDATATQIVAAMTAISTGDGSGLLPNVCDDLPWVNPGGSTSHPRDEFLGDVRNYFSSATSGGREPTYDFTVRPSEYPPKVLDPKVKYTDVVARDEFDRQCIYVFAGNLLITIVTI